MTDLIGRNNLREVDVLLVTALDTPESIGIDIVSDMKNFLSQELSVGIMSLMQSGDPKRYRNSRLIESAFNNCVQILGVRDSCKAQTTIVYHSEVFSQRSLRGIIATENLAFVVDEPEKFLTDGLLELVNEQSDKYSDSLPILLGCTRADVEYLQDARVKNSVLEWQYHNESSTLTESPLKPNRNELWIGAAYAQGNKKLNGELKRISEGFAEEGGLRLCLRDTVPGVLQTGRDDPDIVLGFPFVPDTRVPFIAALDAFIVPENAFQGNEWRKDIYSCLEQSIPVLLPKRLKRYFEDAAMYYEKTPDEVSINDLVKNRGFLDAALFAESRTFAAGRNKWPMLGIRSNLPFGDLSSGRARPDSSGQDTRHNATGGRVCFVTSNGAGMGHLTRLLAVARRLDPDVIASFISLSQACGVVAEYGYDFEYIASKGDLGANGPEWNKFFNKKFMEALDRANPDVVVFDGTWPYQGITNAINSYDATFVWMRRGMWREQTQTTSLLRNTNFHSVIAPGDIAEEYDRGPTRRALDGLPVNPIVVMDKSEILDRKQAREALGIDEKANVMLITLGAGNINKIDGDVEAVIGAANMLEEKWEIFITNPLIADNVPIAESVRTISVYPLAKYALAFDFVISATGYNSYHEWIAYGVPALWIANGNTITDDQIGRAMYAHDHGLGFASGPGASMSISDAIGSLADHDTRRGIRNALAARSFENGAYAAARHLSDLAKEPVN
ncbi:UDP-N-acetylglucosamine--N-acetylmuramyl-(pentapeptide) pyrophosphoryl-undecaprenol N-acetylglucosamine transferase [Arthrobacter livingstonensis]|uniref:UDP-N-acetylglucosamine--N-acetylmuramyl- (pentapeptide) pyrophosphoryl-undecaprenol N-acetylglucosamine transferase n=1 Tax=Arthrobacter livingstonensis TaxID=670078 RepID=UPI0011B64176|nr:UDP-N-acetylglucosamine--N-acetylmuramyl-(pentapeptide) pyrophosphoryl-undecaprenol N-acetylglucosamine transferase [Arthrobacter livingstonensis]